MSPSGTGPPTRVGGPIRSGACNRRDLCGLSRGACNLSCAPSPRGTIRRGDGKMVSPATGAVAGRFIGHVTIAPANRHGECNTKTASAAGIATSQPPRGVARTRICSGRQRMSWCGSRPGQRGCVWPRTPTRPGGVRHPGRPASTHPAFGGPTPRCSKRSTFERQSAFSVIGNKKE